MDMSFGMYTLTVSPKRQSRSLFYTTDSYGRSMNANTQRMSAITVELFPLAVMLLRPNIQDVHSDLRILTHSTMGIPPNERKPRRQQLLWTAPTNHHHRRISFSVSVDTYNLNFR